MYFLHVNEPTMSMGDEYLLDFPHLDRTLLYLVLRCLSAVK